MRDLLAELGDAAVDRQAPGADPLSSTARREPRPALGEDISEPLGDAGRRRTRACHELCLRALSFVGRRRRHEARGGIAGRGQFFVVGVVVRTRHRGRDRAIFADASGTGTTATSPESVSASVHGRSFAGSRRRVTGSGSCRLRSVSDLRSASGGRSSMDLSEK